MEQHYRNYQRNHQIKENVLKTTRVDEPEPSVQSEQTEWKQWNLRKYIYQEPVQELYLSENTAGPKPK